MQEKCNTQILEEQKEEVVPPVFETKEPLTCSLQEAADITGLSYDFLSGQSKIKNPELRLPGFKTGKSTYRVIRGRLPEWLDRKARLA